jgi:hypothetical protein
VRQPLLTFPFVLLLTALFVVSLALQLAHHFLCDHSLVMFAFDGKHYLATCQALTQALMLLLKGDFGAFSATIAGASYCKNLVWDGPIIPGLPAVFFALAGRIPREADWTYFAIFFSVLASYSAVLLALGGKLLTGNSRLAVAAGLMFALYPTTIIATGVYRSEMLAVALMLSLLFALYRAPVSRPAAIAAGIIGGVFAMVKPVMIPAIGLLCIFAGMHAVPSASGKQKEGHEDRAKGGLAARAKLLFVLAAAGVLTILPWSVYTALDCGKISITAERGPSYNAGVGTDIGADGWCTMPETAHTAQAKLSKSPMAVFISEWKAHPLPLAKLTMRRVSRLWGAPWNDFREAVFGVPLSVQIAFHLILVSLGFMGLALFVFFPPPKASGPSVGPRLFGNLAAIALLSHLSFIMFQTMGRYAYTSMPLMALFTVYGFAVLHNKAAGGAVRPRQLFLARTAAFAGLVVAGLIFNLDTFTHAAESHETAHVLHPGQSACRSFDLSGDPAGIFSDASASALGDQGNRTGDMLLLVDADVQDPANLTLRLNGHDFKGPLLPLNCLNGRNYFLFDTMAEHAAFMRTQVQRFRQWRAVLVPPGEDFLSRDGINEIEIVNAGPGDVTLYGDSHPARQVKSDAGSDEAGERSDLLPSPDYFASDRMLVSLTSTESRINTLATVTGLSSRSYVKDRDSATNVARGLSDSLRLELAVAQESPSGVPRVADHDISAAPTAAIDQKLSPQQFHWFARTAGGIKVNKAVLKGVGLVSCDIDLSALKGESSCTQLAVTLQGRARRLSGPGRLGVGAALSNKEGLSQGLGQFADFVEIAKATNKDQPWTDFTLTDVVPISKLGGAARLDKLTLSFLPCPRLESCYGAGRQCSDIEVQDLRVQVKALKLTDIAAKSIRIY